ncbi:MAG: hypothetical protein GY946_11085 [bacterium]|nr:hypothetical protein [bacterium]
MSIGTGSARTLVGLGLLALVVLFAGGGRTAYPGGETLLLWTFENGLPPDGWGWGNWTHVDGAIECRHAGGPPDAYFLPYDCPPNFIMETRVMVMENLAPHGNVQLLIRDDKEVRFESGLRLYADRDSMVIRHRAWSRNVFYDWVETPVKVKCGEWHDLRFGIIDERVIAELDGRPLPIPDLRVPVTAYREPHLAVDAVRARFDEVRIIGFP